MDIEKLKAGFEQTECFKRLEHVAKYTFFEFGAYIKRTDVPADVEKKYGRFITALIFSWSAWKEAHQAVQEGFVLAPKEPTKEMISAGFNELIHGESEIAIYKAMIEAQEQTND